MENEVKLAVENCGSQLCIWIEGDEQSVKERFWSFWNHGATSGELHWQLDSLAYFWTTPEKLKKALVNINLFRLLNAADSVAEESVFKGCKGGAMPYAREQAEKDYHELLTENSQRNQWRYASQTYVHEILDIVAERPDWPSVHTDWNTSHTSLISQLKA